MAEDFGNPTGSGGVRSIPTEYAGVTFRSRLEATWAYNLDAWGIRWSYEPEGVILPSGAWYLPDFWLPEIRTWLEVKGPGVGGLEKTREFVGQQDIVLECYEHFIFDSCEPKRTYQAPERQVIVGYAPEGNATNYEGLSVSEACLNRCNTCRRMSFADVEGGWYCPYEACGKTSKAYLYNACDKYPAPRKPPQWSDGESCMSYPDHDWANVGSHREKCLNPGAHVGEFGSMIWKQMQWQPNGSGR